MWMPSRPQLTRCLGNVIIVLEHSGLQAGLRGEKRAAMPLVALLLLIWGIFGSAVVMMIYGAFEHVGMNAAVMAAVLATGTTFLASLAAFLSWRGRRSAGRD